MSSDKPNFLSQPVVKNLFMYRNGDPYFDARRVVINQKRVCNFETLLREVTAGIQPPFGAVRNIYTPRGGHKVDRLDSMQSGEQYVAAGRERFKKLDYLQIGSRKKRMLQTLPMTSKPLPQSRIIVSARFLKPIREPCTIFVTANGDVLDPAIRFLVHQRTLYQLERILEMITEKLGLRVLGGVRSLYTCEGHQVTDGTQLENGQLYVAAGRDKFKKLPYGDLLFPKARGTRRVKGTKASSLPPIYRLSKQSGNGKSAGQSSESGDVESKASPPIHNARKNSKEQLSSVVREISQARLLSLRKRKSGQSLTRGTSENEDPESGNQEGNATQDQPDKQKLDTDEGNSTEEKGEKTKDKEEAASEQSGKEERKTTQETNGEQEGDTQAANEEKEEVKSEDQGSNTNSDKSQEGKEDVTHTSSQNEKDQNQTIAEEKQDKNSGIDENGSKKLSNDSGTGEKPKESNSSSDLAKTQSDNEAKEAKNAKSSSSNDEHEENSGKKNIDDLRNSQEETKVNGEVSGDDDEVESEAELNTAEPEPTPTEEGGDKHTENN